VLNKSKVCLSYLTIHGNVNRFILLQPFVDAWSNIQALTHGLLLDRELGMVLILRDHVVTFPAIVCHRAWFLPMHGAYR